MKTLINGDLDKAKQFEYFYCKRCGWAGKAYDNEYKVGYQYNERFCYLDHCPCCNANVIFVDHNDNMYKKLIEIDAKSKKGEN